MQQKTTKKADTQANAQKISAGDSENNVKSILPPDFQLNLSDFALFLSVMKVKEAYQDVLSIILNEPDLNLKEVKVEQVILNKSGKRAIRLDAWAQDNKNRQFDMEMQNSTSEDDIRKRSRFYQGLIDTPILKSGKKHVINSFRQLQLFLSLKKIFSEKTLQCTPSVNGAKKFQTFHSQTVPVKFF